MDQAHNCSNFIGVDSNLNVVIGDYVQRTLIDVLEVVLAFSLVFVGVNVPVFRDDVVVIILYVHMVGFMLV